MGGFTYSNCIRDFVNIKQKKQDEHKIDEHEKNKLNRLNQINKSKTIINRNKSIEDFMKYQWSWTV